MKDERWKRKDNLSGGGQGDTFLVIDSKGEYEGIWVQKRLKNKNRIDRFKREVKAGLELSHPNVIRVIDYDLESDRPYFIAEYCSGGALDKADLTQYSVIDKLRLFVSICRGVGNAHSHSNPITHRDIKPANIFLRDNGTPVVGDFGICHMTEEGERLTLVDEAAGPRNFIAPELEDGRTDEVGPRSDVYSLGKLLYWMIAGRVFAREKHRELQFDLIATQNDSTTFFIYEMLDKMIVLEPKGRFPNANVIADEVESAIRRILMNAHPIDLTAPQACTYCGIGFYQKVVKPLPEFQRRLEDDLREFGLSKMANAVWLILVCEHCGNIQMFRLDKTKNPDVWRKKP